MVNRVCICVMTHIICGRRTPTQLDLYTQVQINAGVGFCIQIITVHNVHRASRGDSGMFVTARPNKDRGYCSLHCSRYKQWPVQFPPGTEVRGIVNISKKSNFSSPALRITVFPTDTLQTDNANVHALAVLQEQWCWQLSLVKHLRLKVNDEPMLCQDICTYIVGNLDLHPQQCCSNGSC